ncbi:MAG: signal recognition particle-docking protein FtsY, partial [Calditrichaeota bacterium]
MNLFGKFKKGVSKTRSQVFNRISHAVKAKKKIDDELLEEIEEILISGDVGVETSMELIERVKRRVKKEKYENSEDLLNILKEEIVSIFPPHHFKEDSFPEKPYVIMVVGVNGTGKTTSIAKMGYRFQQKGKRVMFAAADTFRAAAIEQLEVWANRLEIDLIKHQSGSDPAAVVFDAIQAAKARNIDVLIIDTAGRLHTKVNLMEELKKIRRVSQKAMEGTPHLTLLVLDATTGQNALSQAKQFVEAVEADGIILTKLDGTAKGGAIIGISSRLNLPVYYVG